MKAREGRLYRQRSIVVLDARVLRVSGVQSSVDGPWSAFSLLFFASLCFLSFFLSLSLLLSPSPLPLSSKSPSLSILPLSPHACNNTNNNATPGGLRSRADATPGDGNGSWNGARRPRRAPDGPTRGEPAAAQDRLDQARVVVSNNPNVSTVSTVSTGHGLLLLFRAFPTRGPL